MFFGHATHKFNGDRRRLALGVCPDTVCDTLTMKDGLLDATSAAYKRGIGRSFTSTGCSLVQTPGLKNDIRFGSVGSSDSEATRSTLTNSLIQGDPDDIAGDM